MSLCELNKLVWKIVLPKVCWIGVGQDEVEWDVGNGRTEVFSIQNSPRNLDFWIVLEEKNLLGILHMIDLHVFDTF